MPVVCNCNINTHGDLFVFIHKYTDEKSPEQIKSAQEKSAIEREEKQNEQMEITRTLSDMLNIPQTTPLKRFWWFYTWPIQVLLKSIVPNPRVHRKLYPLTFVLCIVLIGVNSYMVYWMVAIIGVTFGIPETVMGMTLLAWGGCLPEAISCVILTRRGGFQINCISCPCRA